ncbi:MAG: SIR2 family protein [Myxococcales bacterium]|nr:SIR2 family protein [Myxococcales bacterium]
MARKETGWDRLAKAASDKNGRGRRVLVPVLGSGFVTQAALDGARRIAARGGRRPRPVDWLEILRGVASDFGLSRAAGHIETDVPGQTTLLWDSMLTELAAERVSPTSRAAHKWEDELRRAVAERLADDRATTRVSRPFVRSFFKLGWEDVLTFNFDSVLLPDTARPAQRLDGGGARASLAARAGNTTVWFPHGHHADPRSIVLGARAYGARVAAMQAAFDEHARVPSPRPTERLPSWVATVLERPLLFVGLSLTREEWTIWWLLAQRARFLARRPPAERPPAFVFARRPAPAERLEMHGAFATLARACELLGVELLGFGDFGVGWQKLARALDWK